MSNKKMKKQSNKNVPMMEEEGGEVSPEAQKMGRIARKKVARGRVMGA